MLPSKTNTLIHNGNPMLNVEQYKRYRALQTRLHCNSMLNVEEYSEYIKKCRLDFDRLIEQTPIIPSNIQYLVLKLGGLVSKQYIFIYNPNCTQILNFINI